MIANPHLFPQLVAFAALPKPGFALMVDAPWGVGKSKALTDWMSGRKDCLYVSLYGAVDGAAIEDALFDALLAKNKALKPPKGLATVAALSEHWAGVRIDLTGAYRRQAMLSLPKVLIFDDLERTEMTPNQLLGRLNQFVEHERRNVILIAHQEKLRLKSNGQPDDYDSIKEKVIGRSIAMKPEVDLALDAFLTEIREQTEGFTTKTKTFFRHGPSVQKRDAYVFLESQKDLLRSVFSDSGGHNLRLLRQAILEFARFYGQLPLSIQKNSLGMQNILATFVALAMAYNGGSGITKDDLDQDVGWARSIWQMNGENGPEPAKTGIEVLRERFVENRYVHLDGTILTGKLARVVISDGHADNAVIASELKNATFFTVEHAEAWQTLWWWPKRSDAEVSIALQQVKGQLKECSLRDEAVILHVAGILLDLADNGIGWNTRTEVVETLLEYIKQLELNKRLPTNRPKGGYNAAFRDQSSYGLEIKQQKSAEFNTIHDKLINALDRAFWTESERRAQDLLELAKTDLNSFVAVLDNRGRPEGLPNYAHLPVLTGADPKITAEVIFNLPPDDIWQILSIFENRIQRLEQIMA